MPRRDAIPLKKRTHLAFVEAAHAHPNNDRQTACLLQVGTGVRGDTLCHIHAEWFHYKRSKEPDKKPPLYLKIPKEDQCRKGEDTEPCGDCNMSDHQGYEPKTPAGEGREILIDDMWTNPVTKEREYFPLRDVVESYFALSGTHAPDGVQHGNNMIQGKGICKGTLNTWVRDVGARADISAQFREDWLREQITIEEDRKVPQIKDFGRDDDGNEIPDLFNHDLRATYCTQLMRNDVPRDKAINKTGHEVPESMDSYIGFAKDEIDPKEETQFYRKWAKTGILTRTSWTN